MKRFGETLVHAQASELVRRILEADDDRENLRWRTGPAHKKFGGSLAGLDTAWQMLQQQKREQEPARPQLPKPAPKPAPKAAPAPRLPRPGYVRIVQFDRERDVPAVSLQPSTNWTSLAGEGHLKQRMAERIDEPDQPDFFETIQRMLDMDIMVPARGHWTLKMPGGYGIFGDGDQGISATSKRDPISRAQQLVENPAMDEYQNRRWLPSRRSL